MESPKYRADTTLTIVPMLRVGMQFVTLCVTQGFCDVRWIEVRLKSPFRPSASYFDGAKVTKPPGSVSGPTSSGSFALSLIRGSPQRAIHGAVRLAWRPARLPPDQRQDSAVTYVALCVVCAIGVEKRFVCSDRCSTTQSVTNCMPTLSIGTMTVRFALAG